MPGFQDILGHETITNFLSGVIRTQLTCGRTKRRDEKEARPVKTSPVQESQMGT